MKLGKGKIGDWDEKEKRDHRHIGVTWFSMWHHKPRGIVGKENEILLSIWRC